MPDELSDPAGGPGGDKAALRALLETVSAEAGEVFFHTLVRTMAGTLGVLGAWVTEYLKAERRLRALAFWLGDGFIPDYEYSIAGTACEPVVENARIVHVPERALELYPGDPDFARLGAVSYLGVPLLDVDGEVLGHLAVLDTRPLREDPRCLAVFQMLAGRAASELSRRRAGGAADDAQPNGDSPADAAEEDREGALLGRSPAVRRLREEIEQVAPADITVLILGETGTGKELVARALHEKSRRRGVLSSPSIAAPCPTPWSRASCSVTRRAPSPARPSGARGASPWPTAERSFSTRLATCRFRCRSSCFVSCRKASSSRSAAHGPEKWTCVSSRRRTAI